MIIDQKQLRTWIDRLIGLCVDSTCLKNMGFGEYCATCSTVNEMLEMLREGINADHT